MYSIKPGRGPSLGSAIGGAIAVVFGIFWTMFAASMGAPGFFVLFGIIFVLAGIGNTVYSLYNATAPNRLSEYDITSHREESDPLSDALRHGHEQADLRIPSAPERITPAPSAATQAASAHSAEQTCRTCSITAQSAERTSKPAKRKRCHSRTRPGRRGSGRSGRRGCSRTRRVAVCSLPSRR